MKKLFLFAVMALSLLMVASCGKKELKQMKGVVTDIWGVQDSLITTRVVSGNDTVLFKLADARYVNGMFLKGDSVQIDYIEGRDDTLRALVISVLPKPVHYIDLKSKGNDDAPLTRPSDTEVPEQPAE